MDRLSNGHKLAKSLIELFIGEGWMQKRALIVDADAAARECLEKVLADLGYETAIALEDDSAFKRFIDFGPEIIFIDTLIPRKGAFELIRKIRQTEGGDSASIFVVSALRGGSLREEAMDIWGALAFLSKPFTEKPLKSKIEDALGIIKDGDNVDASQIVSGMPEQGDFTRATFPRIFATLLKSKVPLRLAVGQGKVRKVIHLDSGEITFARANLIAETLARYLLEAGKLTEAQYRQGVEIAVNEHKLIGDAFVSIGAVTREDVDTAVRANMLEKVSTVFLWDEGWYKVLAHAEPQASIPGGPADGWQLLYSSIKSALTPTQIGELLVPIADQMIAVEEGLPLLALEGVREKELKKIVANANGREVIEVSEDLGAKQLPLFYFLLLRGVLKVENEGLPEEDEETPLQKVNAKLSWMRGRNHFQVLGVRVDSSDKDVSEAYEKIIREMHFGESFDEALRPLIDDVCNMAKKAAEVLYNSKGREDYLESLRQGGDMPIAGEDRARRAEASYREGLAAMRRNRWDEAIDRMGWASDLDPDNVEYRLKRAEAMIVRDLAAEGGHLDKAERVLKTVLEMDPDNFEGYYLMGLLNIKRKKVGPAKQNLNKALALKPGDEKTLQALKEAGQQKSGKFSLFGKR
ncbi:MAG: hypothetical protein C0608_00035 [Deltaproteobacteria bacterium]|nr:MAG: hypothetical protein C0608_00035 [Deltaproteobacteria bacterium]